MREIKDYLQEIEDRDLPVPHTPDTGLLRWLHDRLQDGVLAVSGGVYDQPAHYANDMRFLDMIDYYADLPHLIKDCQEEVERILSDQLSQNRGRT
ncbi:MAG: hypothetical protein ACPG7F_09880 [Aggregatilineales bacterium]